MKKRHFEPLEERIVLDATVFGGFIDAYTDIHDSDDGDATADKAEATTDHPPQAEAPVRILAISEKVAEHRDLTQYRDSLFKIVVYDSENADLSHLLAQLQEAAGSSPVESIALVDNGDSAVFQITDQHVLTQEAVESDAELHAFWWGLGDIIDDGGRIDLLSWGEQTPVVDVTLDEATDKDTEIVVYPELQSISMFEDYGLSVPQAELTEAVELLVVSEAVADYQSFIDAAQDDVEIVLYNPSETRVESLLDAIEEQLNGREASNIAFVNHGDEGEFRFTDSLAVSSESLESNEELSQFWSALGSLMTLEGRVDLLACNVAGSDAGLALISQLETLTDRNVAASTNLTGSSNRGGDWVLETDGINVLDEYFRANAMRYEGVLDTFQITGIIRDFEFSHPDFENKNGVDTGIVENTIGGDRKPVYNGPTSTTTNESNFNEWFNDTPGVNLSTTHTITLDNTITANPDVYTFVDTSFFPIDGQLLGNEGEIHNYSFTYELHATFVYETGQFFEFRGDDDIFVFINDSLVVDLGGVHSPLTGSVDLDTLGLTPGDSYIMDIFFAERHTVGSSFRMDIGLVESFLIDPNPVYGVDGDDSQFFQIEDPNDVTASLIDYGILHADEGAGAQTLGSHDVAAFAIGPDGHTGYFVINDDFGATLDGPWLGTLDLTGLNLASSGTPNVITPIGELGIDGERIEGISFDPTTGTLYGLQADTTDTLVTINTSTGAVTSVGTMSGLSESVTDGRALEFDEDGNLYVSDISDDELYQLDVSTGAIIAVADNNTGLPNAAALAWDPELNAMIYGDATDDDIGLLRIQNGNNTFFDDLAADGITDVTALDTPFVTLDLLPIPDFKIQLNDTVTFYAQVDAAFLDLEDLEFDLDQDSKDLGMSIDPNTGFFTWTPTDTALEDQVYDVTVLVNAPLAANKADTEFFRIQIGSPRILWGVDSEDSTLFYLGDYEDPDNTVIEYGTLRYSNGTDIPDDTIESFTIDYDGKTAYMVINSDVGTSNDPWLAKIDIVDVSRGSPTIVTVVGDIGLPSSHAIKGLSIDPTDGQLYAVVNDGGGTEHLYTIDKTNPATVSDKGEISGSPGGVSYSADDAEDLEFISDGTLYVMDDAGNDIFRVDKTNANILEHFSGFNKPEGAAYDGINDRFIIAKTDSDQLREYFFTTETSSTISDTSSSGSGLTDTEGIDVPYTVDPVIANDDQGSTDEDTPVVINESSLLSNDSFRGSTSGLGFAYIDPFSANGATVTVNGNGTITYDPTASSTLQALDPGETTVDTFRYVINHPEGGYSELATVSITVSGLADPPFATDDTDSTDEDTSINRNAAAGVLSNDTINPGSTVIAYDSSSAFGAVVTVAADGSFTYNPTAAPNLQNKDTGDLVNDTFTYTVQDPGGATDVGTVTVTVTGINDAPVANDDSGYSTDEDSSLAVTAAANGVLDNDTDVDDALVIDAYDATSSLGASVTVNADGTFTYDPTGSATLQALDVGDTTLDTFTYTLKDDDNATSTATVSVTVTGINDPPVANDDSGYATDEDTTLSVTAVADGVLDNDSDVDDPLVIDAYDSTSTLGASVTVNANGTFSYDPTGSATLQALDVGDTTTDTFTYTLKDDNNATSTATVSVVVTGVNDAPVANDDSGYNPNEDDLFQVSAASGVLTNDTDVDDPLVIDSYDTTSTKGASVTVNADGSFDYDASGSLTLQALDVGDTTTDTFTYTLKDDNNATSTATVTLTVTGINDAPVADNDSESTDEDTALSVAATAAAGLLQGDTDVDADDSLSVIAGTIASSLGASVVLGSDGSYSYDPTVSSTLQALDQADTTVDTFTYVAQDSHGATSVATVSITVTGVNDTPVGVNDDGGDTDEDTVLNVIAPGVLDNDTDVDDSASLSVLKHDATSALGASVNVNADGSFSYDPTGSSTLQALDVGDVTTDTFVYFVQDQFGASSAATVSVTVTGLNDGPIANDDSGYDTDEDTAFSVTAVADGVLDNDTDVDDPLVISSFDSTSTLGASVTVNANGTFSYDPSGSATLQQLDPGDLVTDTFTYTLTDDNGASSTATVSVVVTGVNDGPTANDDTDSTDEDTVLNVGPTGVLSNDTDVDLDANLTVISHDSTSTLGAAVTVNANGSFEYDPTGAALLQDLDVGDTTVDTFVYTIDDEHGATSSATVSITVTGVNDAPNAVDDTAATDEDTSFAVSAAAGLLQNDTDLDDDDTRTVQVGTLSSSLGATVVLNSDGSYSYDPTVSGTLQALDQGDTTVDTFTYVVEDSHGATDVGTVSVTVTGVNDTPVAVNDSGNTDEDTVLNVVAPGVLDNDTDVDDSASLSVLKHDATSVLGASVTVNANGSFSYDPTGSATLQALDVGDVTTDTFEYWVQDQLGASSAATVSITVTGLNDGPVANDDSGYDTDEDTLLSVTAVADGALDNDVDVDDPLVISSFDSSSAQGAAVSVNANGTFSYDPTGSSTLQGLDLGDVITDTFTYTLTDDNGASSTATVSVVVTGVNDGPDAVDDSGAITNEDTVLTVAANGVLGNDTDPDDSATLTVASADSTSTLGAAVNVNADGSFTYDPTGSLTLQALDLSDLTTDTFTYTVTDEHGATDTATVSVLVAGRNDLPIGNDDNPGYATDEDSTLNVTAAAGVIPNDSDIDDDAVLSVDSFDSTSAKGASVSVAADGSFSYDPTGSATLQALDPGDTTVDTFTYLVKDEHDATATSVATVSITVTGVNDDPVANTDGNLDTNEDTVLNVAADGVLANDTDVDEDAVLSVSASDGTSAQGAAVNVANDGGFSYDPTGSSALQALDEGDVVVDTFNYTVEDENGAEHSTSVSITVTGVNDAPNAVDDGTFTTDEETSFNVSAASGLLANDTDVDADDTRSVIAYDSSSALGAVVSVNADGSFSYDPSGSAVLDAQDQGDIILDTFTYTIEDSQGATDTATVAITVSGLNDGPIANDDSGFGTDEDTALSVSASGVLGNDSDVDTDAVLTVTSHDNSSALGASVTVNANGSFEYDPSGSATLQTLDPGDVTTDTFVYTIEDEHGASSSATVSILVTGVNDAPVGTDDSNSTDEDTSFTVAAPGLLSNDSDVDGDASLSITSSDSSSSLGATVSVNSNGSYTYDPTTSATLQGLDQGDVTVDLFTYTVEDEHGATDVVTVAVTVTGVNDAPVASDDSGVTISEDSDVNVPAGGVLLNDTDADASASLSVKVADSDTTSVKGAVVSINADGSFNYDPRGSATLQALDPGDSTTDTFTYVVEDQHGATDVGTVTIVVTGENDIPVADDDDGGETDEDTILEIDGSLALDGDTDADEDAVLTIIAHVPTSDLGADISSLAGKFIYDPTGSATLQALDPGDVTTDTFIYVIDDEHGATALATISVVVTGVNDAPVANDDDGGGVDEDSLLASTTILLDNDTDVDDDATLHVSDFDATSTLGADVVVQNDGSFTYDPRTAAALQALDFGDVTTDTFTYETSDEHGATSVATVSIQVTGVNDGPVANDDTASTDEDTAFTVAANGLLGNDTDVDADDTRTVQAGTISSSLGATVVLNADGSYSYDPTVSNTIQALDLADITTDTFTYTIEDSQGATSTATVSVTLTGVNDAPIGNDDSGYDTDEDTVLNVPSNGVLGNDSDIDTDAVLTVASHDSSSALGAAVTVNSNGSFDYDPTGSSTLQNLDQGDVTTDTFVYVVTDEHGATDTATVSIVVTGVNDGPIAADDDLGSTDEDTTLGFTESDLLAGDSDTDDSASLSVLSHQGTSTLGADISRLGSNFTYDPTVSGTLQALDQGDTVTDTFTYVVEDEHGATSVATASIVVTGVNDTPTANDDSDSTDEDTVINSPAVLLDNDTDVDDSAILSVSDFDSTSTLGASVNVGSDGSYTYDPTGSVTLQGLDFGDVTTDTFTYEVSDQHGATSVATVSITVTGVNDIPDANDDTNSTDEDTAFTVAANGLLGDDTDVDADDTRFVQAGTISSSLGATVVLNADGSYSYDPTVSNTLQALDVGDLTTDTFTYTIEDSQGATNTATVSVTVTGVNDAPIGNDDGPLSTNEDGTLGLLPPGVLGNDSDIDDSAILTVASHDSTSSLGADITVTASGAMLYDPTGSATLQALDDGDVTTDTFVYVVTDEHGATDTATVSILVTGVNDTPNAVDDTNATDEDTAFTVAANGLLGNDTDVDADDTRTVQAGTLTSSLGATVVLNANGSYSYDPTVSNTLQALDQGDVTTDTFTYTIEDSLGATDTATVSITVTGVNDGPNAVNDNLGSTDEDTAVNITPPGVLGNDTDVDDSATASVSSFDSTSTLGATVNVNADGSLNYNPSGSATLQALDPGDVTTDTFTYTMEDQHGASSTATVSIVVSGVNDAPIANDDDVGDTNEDSTLGFIETDLTGNDSDVDGDASLSVQSYDGTSSLGASITNIGSAFTYDPTGSATLQALDAGDVTTDTFTYVVTDEHGATSIATASVTVTGVNDGPIANDDSASTDEDTLINGTAPGVLDNDSDVDDSSTLTVDSHDATSSLGATVVVNANGSYSYDPSGSATLQALDQGDVTTDTFTYTVIDDEGATATATVSVLVTGVNDDPNASADSDSTDEDTVLNGSSVLTNDTDVDDSSSLTVDSHDATSALGATVNVNANGTFTYDPTGSVTLQALDEGDVTTDTFTYVVTDEHGATDTATVSIVVTGVNDAPNAVDDDGGDSDEDTPIVGLVPGVLGNDTDVDADDSFSITAFDSSSTLGATVVVNADGSYSYDPLTSPTIQGLQTAETTVDTFTYTIEDSQGATDVGTVTVLITGSNDAPAANNDNATTTEDDVLRITFNEALANDTDPDNGNLFVIAFDNSSAGGAPVTEGSFVYDPSNTPAIQALAQGQTFNDTFTYTVGDGLGGTSVATINIKVIGVNDAPEVNPIADQTLEVGDVISLSTIATDIDTAASNLVYSLDATSLALGFNIDPNTGVITYTAGTDLAGSAHAVQVTVFDGYDSTTVVFNVSVGAQQNDQNNDANNEGEGGEEGNEGGEGEDGDGEEGDEGEQSDDGSTAQSHQDSGGGHRSGSIFEHRRIEVLENEGYDLGVQTSFDSTIWDPIALLDIDFNAQLSGFEQFEPAEFDFAAESIVLLPFVQPALMATQGMLQQTATGMMQAKLLHALRMTRFTFAAAIQPDDEKKKKDSEAMHKHEEHIAHEKEIAELEHEVEITHGNFDELEDWMLALPLLHAEGATGLEEHEHVHLNVCGYKTAVDALKEVFPDY